MEVDKDSFSSNSLQEIKNFISKAEDGLSTKYEIEEKKGILGAWAGRLVADSQAASKKLLQIGQAKGANYDGLADKLIKEYGSVDELTDRITNNKNQQHEIKLLFDQLSALESNYKNFDKTICFSNIRELLRTKTDVKIGQIEKEAGVSPGYMSRLEKEGSTAEPSVEFVVTAANLLGVSIDTLISINLTELTPTEQYISRFFDKLKSDTLEDKLDWLRETPLALSNLKSNGGYIGHPLFSEEVLNMVSDDGYPQQEIAVMFVSKTFGLNTKIAGDCFHLKMKNGTTLYLMDIEKRSHTTNDQKTKAIEAWVYVPGKNSEPLVASQDDTSIASLVEVLFETVSERMKHPKINRDVQYAIDAFMKDDISDDTPDPDSLPFM